MWAASAELRVTSVKRSACLGVVTSGVGVQDGGEGCGSCDGGCAPEGDGALLGCGGDGGAGMREAGPAGAGVDVSACGDGRLDPAVSSSSPSCGP